MGLKRGAGAVQWGSADHERTQSSVFLYKSVHRFEKTGRFRRFCPVQLHERSLKW